MQNQSQRTEKSYLRRSYFSGFTLIEILIVIGMIAILASVVLVAINPVRQFAQAKNSQRVSNVNAILNAIGNRMAENRGLFTDTASCTVALPTNTTLMGNVSTAYDIRPCLVPTYISELPFDPSTGKNTCTSTLCSGNGESYATGYTVKQDAGTGRITVCAPGYAEPSLNESASYCLTR